MKPYLRVRNWTKFQHYKVDLDNPDPKKRRRLGWVKYHLDELDDDEFLDLPHAAQLLFHRLLLLEARAVNRGTRGFRSENESLATRVRMDAETVANMLPLLLKGGWLSETQTNRPSSSSLATPERAASVEEEEEEEKDLARTRARQTPPPRNDYEREHPHVCPNTGCRARLKSERRLLEHLENAHNLEGEAATAVLQRAGYAPQVTSRDA